VLLRLLDRLEAAQGRHRKQILEALALVSESCAGSSLSTMLAVRGLTLVIVDYMA
jgi:hypothetical protein